MEETINAAQERLIKKREQLGVTAIPTPLMQNIELSKRETETELCEHGIQKNKFCYPCHEERENRQYIIDQKEKFKRQTQESDKALVKMKVPKKYLNVSFDTYSGNDKLVKECRKHTDGGIVLFGNTGCGKTHLAVSLMREKYINDLKGLIEQELKPGRSYQPTRQLFKPVPDLLLEIRSSFNEKSPESEQEIIDKYARYPFLVLDDLGSEKTSEYAVTTLYIIIDRRDREVLPTVITTNLSLQEIEEKLSARISSRLAGMKNIKINMPDYRKKR